MKKLLTLLAIAMGLVATPAAAQRSAGEDFLTAVREDDRGAILEAVNDPGFTLVNFRGYKGETALHILVEDKRENWVRLLLRKGADANAKRADGETPLTLAAQRQSIGMVEDLLAYEADPDAGNRFGETALMFAVRLRNPRLIRMLVAAGANPDQPDTSAGLSARDYARRDTRNPELLALLDAKSEENSASKLKFGPILR